MITLYIDREQLFECKVKVEGTDFNKVVSRLIISPTGSSKHLFIEGVVEGGICKIKIPPITEISKNGNISLEVIVDNNNIFKPWNSTYELTAEKKITVENIEINKKNNLLVSVSGIKEVGKKKVIKENLKRKKMMKKNVEKRMDDLLTDTIKNAVRQTLKESK